MGKSRRKQALALGLALGGVLVWAACGDDDAVVTSPLDAGTDAETDQHTPLRDATQIIDDDASDEDAKKPTKPRGPYDAGPENFQTFDGGDIDGGIPCVQGGELEIESNDTKAMANPMDPPSSRCGVARVGDAGADAAESDMMTFTLSSAASNFYVQYHGDGVVVTVQAGDDGGVQDITQPNVTLPFEHNTPYYVEVKSKTGKNEVWRVSVFEDK